MPRALSELYFTIVFEVVVRGVIRNKTPLITCVDQWYENVAFVYLLNVCLYDQTTVHHLRRSHAIRERGVDAVQ